MSRGRALGCSYLDVVAVDGETMIARALLVFGVCQVGVQCETGVQYERLLAHAPSIALFGRVVVQKLVLDKGRVRLQVIWWSPR